MGTGTEKNPYTRKDVLRLIKKNGGTAAGLDLSGKYFEDDIDLRGLDFNGIKLQKVDLMGANLQGIELIGINLQGANLSDTNLQGSNLASINLENASIENANLQEANLADANLQRADLRMANLQGARLWHADLRRALLWDANLKGAMLEEVKWDSKYMVGDEPEPKEQIPADARQQFLGEAESVYRHLKSCHMEHGLYNIAGKFFYREMEARRKAQSWKQEPLQKLWSWTLKLLCGYGEKPQRVAISAAAIVFGLAAAYFFWGSFSSTSFWDTLYYSVASFTALGYGQWAPQPTGWAKGVGAAEAVLGVSMLALFLVTFTRKVSR